jgi:hypothetical protein
MYFFSHSDYVPVYLYERFPILVTGKSESEPGTILNDLPGAPLAMDDSLLESGTMSYPPLGVQ